MNSSNMLYVILFFEKEDFIPIKQSERHHINMSYKLSGMRTRKCKNYSIHGHNQAM